MKRILITILVLMPLFVRGSDPGWGERGNGSVNRGEECDPDRDNRFIRMPRDKEKRSVDDPGGFLDDKDCEADPGADLNVGDSGAH